MVERPCSDVDSDSGDIVLNDLDLSSVNGRPNLQARADHRFTDGQRTTRCPGWNIEGCENTIARRLNKSAAMRAHDDWWERVGEQARSHIKKGKRARHPGE